MSPGSCLDPNDLVGFLRGDLSEEESSAIDQHVDACSACRSLLVEMAKLETKRPPSREPNLLRDIWNRGETVDRYVVLDRIGAGTMGVVYSAYDPKLDRKVALKVLRTRRAASIAPSREPSRLGSADDLKARLLREAQALARLSHPSVLSVYDVGTFQGDVFIAMEFVDGSTLRQWLAQGDRHWRETLDVLLRSGEGIAAAHQAGVVHRDLKPDNILVGKDGRVRVMDFGLARATGTAVEPEGSSNPAGECLGATQSGALVGTPAYMAPEQLAGEVADARSDQFAFCVMAYEALFGRLPFEGTSLEELAASKSSGKVEETSGKAARARQVRRVILKGLSASPADRYPTMADLLVPLRAKPVARRRTLAVAFFALAIAGAAAYRQMSPRQPQLCTGAEHKLAGIWDDPRRAMVHSAFASTRRPNAERAFAAVQEALNNYSRQWASMHAEACEATRIRGEQSEEMLDRRMSCLGQRLNELTALVEVFQRADARTVDRVLDATGGLASVARCADLAALRSGLALPEDPRVRSEVEKQRQVLASVKALALSGRFREALETASSVPAAAHALGYLPLEAEALFSLGETQGLNTQYREAESSFTEAVMLAEAGGSDELAARASNELVHIVGHGLERFEASLFWERYAKAAIQRLGGNEELSALLAYNKGSVLALQGKEKRLEAVEALQDSVTRFERLLGPESRRLLAPLQGLGLVLSKAGQDEQAEASFSRALSIAEKTAGPETTQVGSIYLAMAGSHFIRGDYVRQRELAERGLRILEKTLPPKHFGIATALQHLGFALAELGEPDRAVECAEKALQLTAEIKGPRNPSMEDFHRVYGNALIGAGHFVKALDHYQQAASLLETAKNSPNLPADLTGIGRAWLGMHRPLKALAPLERALRLGMDGAGGALSLANTQFYLAQALWDSGRDKARARALALTAREAWSKNGLNPRKVAAIDAWLDAHQRRPRA